MRILGFSCCALMSCAAPAMLGGCGAWQPPIGAPGALAQTSAIATHAEHGKSWMLPGTRRGDLIYATGGCGGTCVISYPDLALVGEIPTVGNAICSDSQGNIFIPVGGSAVEYSHGGTEPIAVLSLPYGQDASGCSVDARTNDLAVVFKGKGADVAVFANERGTPTLYGTGIDSKYCGFDNKSNLFVNGYGDGLAYTIAELAAGSSTFSTYQLANSVGTPGQVQWDGQYITYQSEGVPSIISRLSISGSKATVVATVVLKNIRHRQSQSWIYNENIIVPFNDRGSRRNIVGIWKYPDGGKIVKSIRKFVSFKKREIDFQGVALSVSP
jgi:hypothetical protein